MAVIQKLLFLILTSRATDGERRASRLAEKVVSARLLIDRGVCGASALPCHLALLISAPLPDIDSIFSDATEPCMTLQVDASILSLAIQFTVGLVNPRRKGGKAGLM